MEYRQFGRHDFQVSAIGYGAGHIGGPHLSDSEVNTLLNSLLEWGVNLFDTAPSYDLSEERIGRFVSGIQRERVILSTKLGYGIEGTDDWTYDCVIKGVDRALLRLQTDYLDIAHFHSCPKGTLEYGEVARALHDVIQAGKVRVAAYSGENEALEYAIQSGDFGSVQTSVNLTDQQSLMRFLPKAHAAGMGLIAKRPMANAFWRFQEKPQGEYCEAYWVRWQDMGLDFDLPLNELALRFSVFSGVHSCIIGSTNLAHIRQNIELIKKGPLDEEIIKSLVQGFNQEWAGQV